MIGTADLLPGTPPAFEGDPTGTRFLLVTEPVAGRAWQLVADRSGDVVLADRRSLGRIEDLDSPLAR